MQPRGQPSLNGDNRCSDPEWEGPPATLRPLKVNSVGSTTFEMHRTLSFAPGGWWGRGAPHQEPRSNPHLTPGPPPGQEEEEVLRRQDLVPPEPWRERGSLDGTARERQLEGGQGPRLLGMHLPGGEASFLKSCCPTRRGRAAPRRLPVFAPAQNVQVHRPALVLGEDAQPLARSKARSCGAAATQQAAPAPGGARGTKLAKWPPRGQELQEDVAKPPRPSRDTRQEAEPARQQHLETEAQRSPQSVTEFRSSQPARPWVGGKQENGRANPLQLTESSESGRGEIHLLHQRAPDQDDRRCEEKRPRSKMLKVIRSNAI